MRQDQAEKFAYWLKVWGNWGMRRCDTVFWNYEIYNVSFQVL